MIYWPNYYVIYISSNFFSLKVGHIEPPCMRYGEKSTTACVFGKQTVLSRNGKTCSRPVASAEIRRVRNDGYKLSFHVCTNMEHSWPFVDFDRKYDMPVVTSRIWRVSAFGKLLLCFFNLRYNAKEDCDQTNTVPKSDIFYYMVLVSLISNVAVEAVVRPGLQAAWAPCKMLIGRANMTTLCRFACIHKFGVFSVPVLRKWDSDLSVRYQVIFLVPNFYYSLGTYHHIILHGFP